MGGWGTGSTEALAQAISVPPQCLYSGILIDSFNFNLHVLEEHVPAPAICAPVRNPLAGVAEGGSYAVTSTASSTCFCFFNSRLIMSTHRDLEAFKRRKTKSLPYLKKGFGSLPRGDQSWRDL